MHGAVRVGARRRSADRSCCRFGANSLFVSTRWQIAPRINSQLNDAEGRAREEERMRDEMKQKFRYGCTGLRGSGRVRVCARCGVQSRLALALASARARLLGAVRALLRAQTRLLLCACVRLVRLPCWGCACVHCAQ